MIEQTNHLVPQQPFGDDPAAIPLDILVLHHPDNSSDSLVFARRVVAQDKP